MRMARGIQWAISMLTACLWVSCSGSDMTKPGQGGDPPRTGGPVDANPDGPNGLVVRMPPVQRPPTVEEAPPRSGFPPPPTHLALPPLQVSVEEYRVRMDEGGFRTMLATRTDEVFPAEFTGPDGRKQPIAIRLRGNSSRGWRKKSYRIEFPAGVKWDGRGAINLVSSWREQTFMLEKLGFDILEAMGVPAPRVKYVRLTVNGEYQGIYLDIERVDKSFLRNHGFTDTDASIWRCGMKNCEMKTFADSTYQEDWEKQTNELQPGPELDDFMRAINHTPEPQFARMLASHFELDHHLRAIVMDALISNATVEDSRSYVIYDAVTQRWSYVPWDLNNTDAKYPFDGKNSTADFNHPLFNHSLFDEFVAREYEQRASGEPGRWKPIFSNLNTRIVLRPELRRRILDLTEQALEELFAPETINARIDATYALLRPHFPGSPYDNETKFKDAPRYMKEYVVNRTGFLRSELQKWRSWKPTLVIQSVDPATGTVELKNMGDASVNTSGMMLTSELRASKGGPARAVPSRTLAPGETLQLNVALAPEGEVGLFDGKSVVGVVDLLFYGTLPQGKRYVRGEGDPLEWEVR